MIDSINYVVMLCRLLKPSSFEITNIFAGQGASLFLKELLPHAVLTVVVKPAAAELFAYLLVSSSLCWHGGSSLNWCFFWKSNGHKTTVVSVEGPGEGGGQI